MAGGITAQTDGVDAIADRPAPGSIRAAGGLVARDGQVLLVHRPRFDDWSLPKGKRKRGEHPLAAAVREVHEETGVWGWPGIRLPSVSYQVRSGQSLVDKTVDWWAMTVAEDPTSPPGGSAGPDTFTPTDEVDERTWLPVSRALDLLTYERDRLVVSAYAALPPLHRPVVLLRHAQGSGQEGGNVGGQVVGKVGGQAGLDPVGREHAAAIARLLPLLGPRRLVSAPAMWCRQTLADLARELDLEVEIDARFDLDADPDAVADALRNLAADDAATVVCSEDGIISAALARLSGRPAPEHTVAPGDGLVLSFSADTLVAADPVTAGAGPTG